MVLNVLCLNLKLVILREKSHLHLVNCNGIVSVLKWSRIGFLKL